MPIIFVMERQIEIELACETEKMVGTNSYSIVIIIFIFRK